MTSVAVRIASVFTQAAEQLLCSEGWARWVRVRAMFHSYPAGNCMLLAAQCHQRRIVPTRIAGFRTWLKLGRCVRKGEVALRILVPVTLKQRDDLDDETADARRVFFKTAFGFNVSQVDVLDGAGPLELEPPSGRLTGDTHAHLPRAAANVRGVARVCGCRSSRSRGKRAAGAIRRVSGS